VIAGVTNGSGVPAPLPIAAWVGRDREICKTGLFTARLAIAHAHARNGRPVAAVRFIATDGTNRTEVLVSAMSSVLFPASGYTVPHFAADLDLSGLADGAAITIDAILYPWVGAAFQLSIDADPYPSPNLTTLRVLNDRTGGFGTAYAYVDPVSGTAGGVASAVAATAAAAPFQTYGQAGAAIRAYNNANFGRNYADGGIIRLVEGTHHTATNARTGMPTLAWPLTIESADPGKRASTVFGDPGTSTTNTLPACAVIRGLTLRRGGSGNLQAFNNAAAALDYSYVMAFEGCDFDNGGYGAYNGFANVMGLGYFINCTETSNCGQGSRVGNVNKTTRSIGCKGTGFGVNLANWGVLGCWTQGTEINLDALTTVRPAGQGGLIGWSFLQAADNSSRGVTLATTTGPRGVAIVGCILEQPHGVASACAYFAADGNVQPQRNTVFMSCTVVGARTNWHYQDSGSARVEKSGYMRFVAQEYRNTKTDVFAANGTMTGNWAASYNVGHCYNYARRGGSDAGPVGAGRWLGEVAAPGDQYGIGTALNPAWLNDQSTLGGGAGNGDYTPGPATDLPRIPAGMTPYPVDLLGREIRSDGAAVVGALQMAP